MKVYVNAFCLFLAYMYYYLTAELFISSLASKVLMPQEATILYGVATIFAGAGFFSFFIIESFKSITFKKIKIYGIFIVNIICLICSVLVESKEIFTFISCLITLTAGFFGAAVLYYISKKGYKRDEVVWVITSAYMSAFAIQMIVREICKFSPSRDIYIELLALIIAISSVLFIIINNNWSILYRENLHPNTKEPLIKKYLIGALLVSAILSLLFGLNDGIIMILNANNEINVYEYVRLLAIPGLLMAGFFAAFREGRFFPTAVISSMILMTAAVFLFNTSETFNYALGSVYVLGAFMSIYPIVTFVEVAARSDAPAFWAGAGRGMKYFVSGIATIASSTIFIHISIIPLLVIYLVFLVALLASFYYTGLFTPYIMDVTDEPIIKTDGPISLARQKYSLTIREEQMLTGIANDLTNCEIATKYFISENTVKFHIKNLMKKMKAGGRQEVKSVVFNLRNIN